MKKLLLSSLLVVSAITAVTAQALLPASWGFPTAALPTGWSATSGFTYYGGSGNPAPAAKFDATGRQLVIYIAAAPGNLTYDIAGNSFSGGTFLVEQSPDGLTYTTLHSFTTLTATYTPTTDVPNAATRYIRFNYSNKVTGNVGLDNVNIAVGAATPAQEINVQVVSTSYPSNTTYYASSPVSTLTTINFTIQNLGTVNTLNINNALLLGPDAADFNVVSFPTTVTAGSSGTLQLSFTPSVAGTRQAALVINNDDGDESSYVIQLYGVGGSFATEPIYQPTGLNITNVKSYRFNASFTNAFGMPDGYLVLRKKGSAITDVPVDGVAYQRGDAVGASSVVYAGTQTAFAPNYFISGNQYFFAIFSYNGPGIYRNYLDAAPLTGNVTMAGTMQPTTLYNGINTASATFVADLHALVNPHTHLYYSDYDDNVINLFESRDTSANQRVLTCVYSGQNKVYTEPFDFTSNNFSREHTWCHQWMPDYPSTTSPSYEDYHMLFPANQNDVNALRSNYPLGVVVTPTYTFMGCKLGPDAAGHVVFEPRDSDKGDAARGMMYEAICYTTVGGLLWNLPNPISGSIPYAQSQVVLKQWNLQDPPDGWEIARNDFIDSVQGNRNPFVDSSRFACFIDFTTMTYSGSNGCNGLGVEENNVSEFLSVYPNPATENVNVTFVGFKNEAVKLTVYNMFGQVVIANDVKTIAGKNNFVVNTSALSKGIYELQLSSSSAIAIKQFVVE